MSVTITHEAEDWSAGMSLGELRAFMKDADDHNMPHSAKVTVRTSGGFDVIQKLVTKA